MSLSVCSTISQMSPKYSVFVYSCPAPTFALSCYNSLTVDEMGGLSTSDVFKAQTGSAWGKEDGWVDTGKCCDNGQRRESAKERVAYVTTGKHREALCIYIVGLAPCW